MLAGHEARTPSPHPRVTISPNPTSLSLSCHPIRCYPSPLRSLICPTPHLHLPSVEGTGKSVDVPVGSEVIVRPERLAFPSTLFFSRSDGTMARTSPRSFTASMSLSVRSNQPSLSSCRLWRRMMPSSTPSLLLPLPLRLLLCSNSLPSLALP